MDLRSNQVNLASTMPERQVLPTPFQHAKDVAELGADLREGEDLWTMILDIQDAFCGIPLHPDEYPFNCCSLSGEVRRTRAPLYEDEPAAGRFVVWTVLGFGGKSNPLVFGRAISLAARMGQALFRPSASSSLGSASAAPARTQLYVDDPIATFAGSESSCMLGIDLLISFWLLLGLPLAWTKGQLSSGPHTWIGATFSPQPSLSASSCIVAAPQKFQTELLDLLASFARGTGSEPESTVDRLLGKAGRLAYLVPTARPFVCALWGAYSGSKAAAKAGHREAPPKRHACRRFSAAARWLQTLLQPPKGEDQLLPLEHTVLIDLPPLDEASPAIQADASPWGGGAILFVAHRPVEYFQLPWSKAMASKFGVLVGEPAGQTTWELLTLYLALEIWGFEHRATGLLLMGDNTASLSSTLSLKGKSALTQITKELAWRKVRRGWRYAAGHLPSEMNTLADSLSRVTAPEGSERRSFPKELESAAKRETPDWDSLWVCS